MTTRPRTPAPNAPAPGTLPLTDLVEMKRRGEKIVMVTAYDAPSGALADAAGVDLVLVGDSAAMTVLGHDSTVPATMDEMLVLEAVPAPVAERITAELEIPTIGIGAGGGCDGQVLVWHDLLGLYEGHAPRFVTQYANLAVEIKRALESYVAEVRSGAFPDEQHTYAMPAEELAVFEAEVAVE